MLCLKVLLRDIWKGKITSSGVVYNSFRKGRTTENVTGTLNSITSIFVDLTSNCFSESSLLFLV